MDKMLRSQGDIDPMNEPFQLSEIPLGAASFPDPLPLSIIGTAGPSTGMDLRRWQQSPEGRYTTDDVRAMAIPTLSHRLIVRSRDGNPLASAKARAAAVVEILKRIPIPE